MSLMGFKTFRFSFENLRFRIDQAIDSIRTYLGPKNAFRNAHYIKGTRPFALYTHQETFLQEMREARKRGVNTSGRIMIGMKGRIGMQKITKEDWDCIFNTESPDFEKKFNALVSKYIEKREAEIPNMDKSEQIGYRKGMDTFKYFFKYENWLTVLPIDTKIAFTEQGRKQQKIENLKKELAEFKIMYEENKKGKLRAAKLGKKDAKKGLLGPCPYEF